MNNDELICTTFAKYAGKKSTNETRKAISTDVKKLYDNKIDFLLEISTTNDGDKYVISSGSFELMLLLEDY